MRTIFYVISLCLGSLPLAAEPGVVVTLANVGQRVRAQNPELAAAQMAIAEATGRSKQAGRLENPELETSAQYNARSHEHGVEIGLMQRFPVTQRLSLEKQAGEMEITAARQEVAEVANRLTGEARAAVVQVLAVRGRETLLDKQVALAKQLAQLTTEMSEKGEGSALDTAQAKLELGQWELRRRQLNAEEQQVLGKLKPLLGMKLDEIVHVSGTLPSPEIPGGIDISARPAMTLARLAVETAGKQAEIERTKRYGDVAAGAFIGGERVVDAPEPARRELIAGVKFSMPLPFWNKNEGQIEAADATVERRRREAVALRQEILLEAEATIREMREWARLANQIEKEMLPQAEEQLKLTEKIWREGQGDMLAVLRAREQSLELAASRLDALAQFHLAMARYKTATGQQ